MLLLLLRDAPPVGPAMVIGVVYPEEGALDPWRTSHPSKALAAAVAAAFLSLVLGDLSAWRESGRRGAWYEGMRVSTGGSADLLSLMGPSKVEFVK